jgi:hypothetical protein
MFKTSTQAIFDFGMIPPPVSINKVDKELYAASWACLRETLVVGKVPRYFKEAVAAGASVANECPYCVGAHQMMFNIYKPGKRKLGSNQDEIFNAWDPEKLKEWASSCFLNEKERPIKPFPKQYQAEIIGTAVYFHYLTRMVTIHLGDSLIPKMLEWMVPIMMPFMRLFMGLNNKRKKKVGASQIAHVSSEGGPDWADEEHIRIAFAQFSQLTEDKIIKVIDQSMIDCINSFLSDWHGVLPSIGAGWVDPHIEKWGGTDIQKKQQLKVMLQTIASPYMIVDEDKKRLKEFMGHKNLVLMITWASLKAALKTGQIISKD